MCKCYAASSISFHVILGEIRTLRFTNVWFFHSHHTCARFRTENMTTQCAQYRTTIGFDMNIKRTQCQKCVRRHSARMLDTCLVCVCAHLCSTLVRMMIIKSACCLQTAETLFGRRRCGGRPVGATGRSEFITNFLHLCICAFVHVPMFV